MAAKRHTPPSGRAPRAVALVIPSLGASTLDRCLDAVGRLEPQPHQVIVVLSGASPALSRQGIEIVRSAPPLGFAAAVNLGVTRSDEGCRRLAILNDDAVAPPHWLETLGCALDSDDRLAAVQSTITDADGRRIDGRGITFDRWGLPVQVDRGKPVDAERPGRLQRSVAVSGTAALFRRAALAEASSGGLAPFDPAFGSYHEDLDLGLRLRRLGWSSGWVGGAPVHHVGSATGSGRRWRHPWWLLANRWRALAGNLTPSALAHELPRLVRGEVRAARTLTRGNPRAPFVTAGVAAVWPGLVLGGWRRTTPGARLVSLPGVP